MKVLRTIKMCTLFAALTSIAACTVVPDQIDVADNTSLVAYEDVKSDILAMGPTSDSNNTQVVSGGKARWGGKIVSVVNKKEVSEIEVVFFPENSFGKPKTGMPSAGRFKAVVEGFVDPLVFEEGRLITVVGEVSESQVGIIGEQEYIYPTLNAMGYYMWKETSDVRVELDAFAFSPFSYRSAFHRNFFNPWYDPWMMKQRRSRLRIERYNGHSQGGSVGSRQSSSSRESASSSQNRMRANPRDGQQTGKPTVKQ